MNTMLMIAIAAVVILLASALLTRIGAAIVMRHFPPEGQFVDVDGARLHFVDRGPGDRDEPVTVLIHGASCNLRAVWQPLGEILSRRRRVVAFDRPGHGWSGRERLSDSTPLAQARLIDAALDKLGIERVVFVGHSWGGAVLPALALLNPKRAAGLVMLAPVTHPWDTGIDWYHRLATMPLIGRLFAFTVAMPLGFFLLGPGARGVFQPQLAPDGYVQDTALSLLLRPREFLANSSDMVRLREAVAALQPSYREITAPTVLVHGDADVCVSIDIHARAFVRQVAHARLIELPGVGHMVQNIATDRVIEVIEEMLGAAATRQAAAE